MFSFFFSWTQWKTDNWIYSAGYQITCLKQVMDNSCSCHVEMDSRCITVLLQIAIRCIQIYDNRKSAALQEKTEKKEKTQDYT